MANVDTIIADARAYAASLQTDTATALADAKTSIEAIDLADFTYTQPDNLIVPTESIPNVPYLNSVNFVEPTLNAEVPVFQDIDNLDTSGMPVFDVLKPIITMPDKPSELSEFNINAPTIDIDTNFPDIPDALKNINIPEPIIKDRLVPEKPNYVIPEFISENPIIDFEIEKNLDSKFIQQYNNTFPQMKDILSNGFDEIINKTMPGFNNLVSKLENKLESFLNGGTGLSESVENAIYERSRDKVNSEYIKLRDTLYNDISKKGFTLPNGSLLSGLRNARQSAYDNNARASIEISIKQAELEQQNIQNALNKITELKSNAVNSALQYQGNLININNQALEFSKNVLGFIIEGYNSSIKLFSLKLDKYKVDASIHETKIKVISTMIEIYKSEIQALESLTRIDIAKIEVYKARIDSLQALSGIYKAQVDSIISKANLEKLKIDIYSNQVQAFGMRVNAKNSEWQAYNAAINGEESKIKMYQSEISAWNSQLDGYKTKITSQQEAIKARSIQNQSLSDNYKAQVDVYRTLVSAKGDVARIKLENNSQTLQSFNAQVNAINSNINAKYKYFEVQNNINTIRAQNETNASMKLAEFNFNKQNKVADLSIQLAQVYNSAAATATSGLISVAEKSE